MPQRLKKKKIEKIDKELSTLESKELNIKELLIRLKINKHK